MSRRSVKPTTAPERKAGELYGFPLTLRALASAAIDRDGVSLAMLRVLCVLAEHMDQEGECRVGQDMIAARLGVSRQAVNKQIAYLKDAGIIERHDTTGKTARYVLLRDQFKDAASGRAGWDHVETRREEKREVRRIKRAAGKAPASSDQ